jgi:hypothetical protein
MLVRTNPTRNCQRVREHRARRARHIEILTVEVDTAQLAQALEAAGLTPPNIKLCRHALQQHAALLLSSKVTELKNAS